MKRYEKVLILLVIISFALQFFVSNTSIKLFLFLSVWALAFSYIIGGYWILAAKESKKISLSILAGLAFGLSIMPIPFIVKVIFSKWFYLFPVLNGALCLFLILYIIRSRNEIGISMKNIFKRSIIILLISSFFIYVPYTSNKPFRHFLKMLNYGDKHIENNVLMFDYISDFQKAYKNNNCDEAINYALKAHKAGKLWLGVDEGENEVLDDTEAHKIGITYLNLYKAYRCKADVEFDNKKFDNALQNYQIAHNYLLASQSSSAYWKEEEIWSLNNIAMTHRNLNQLSMADSLHVEAIEMYDSIVGKKNRDYALLLQNLGISQMSGANYQNSENMFLGAISILEKDSKNEKSREDLAKNYILLGYNFAWQGKFKEALTYADKAYQYAMDKSIELCQIKQLQGHCLLALNDFPKSELKLKESLSCFENNSKNDSYGIVECNFLLSKIKLMQAQYDEAESYISAGMKILENLHDTQRQNYVKFLDILADLKHTTGDYKEAESLCQQAIGIYEHSLNSEIFNLSVLKIKLSSLKIKLSKFDEAKQLYDETIPFILGSLESKNYQIIGLQNSLANVNYGLGNINTADSLFKNEINLNKQFGFENSLETAVALGGLANIEGGRGSYKTADSLFRKSLNMCEQIFNGNSPIIASVYLNYGIMQAKENKLEEAENNINIAMSMYKDIFKENHDVFADIYVAKGDIYEKRANAKLAKENYIRALEIYRAKFDEDHWIIIITKRKL